MNLLISIDLYKTNIKTLYLAFPGWRQTKPSKGGLCALWLILLVIKLNANTCNWIALFACNEVYQNNNKFNNQFNSCHVIIRYIYIVIKRMLCVSNGNLNLNNHKKVIFRNVLLALNDKWFEQILYFILTNLINIYYRINLRIYYQYSVYNNILHKSLISFKRNNEIPW